MKTPKRRHERTTEGCREARRPTPEARARYADAQGQAALRRILPRF